MFYYRWLCIVSFDKSDVVFQPPCLDKSDVVFQPPCLDKSVYIFQPTPDWKYYSSLYREIVYNESLWNLKVKIFWKNGISRMLTFSGVQKRIGLLRVFWWGVEDPRKMKNVKIWGFPYVWFLRIWKSLGLWTWSFNSTSISVHIVFSSYIY